MSTTTIDDARTQTAAAPRHIAAAVIGNALEVFDFTTYTYFAVQIGRAFFPAHDPLVTLLLSLATFGVGFAGRPVGAFVFGLYADRKGRKPALMTSLALMGLGVLMVALMPPYATIGAAAPVLVVLARLVQGFALGGELGPATAFLVEIAPRGERGLYGSWQLASQGLATLTSGIIGVTVSSLLSADAMQAYGWRVPFLFGAAVLPLALLLRGRFPETHANAAEAEPPATASLLRSHRRVMALGLLMIIGTTIPFYVLSYMTTFAITTLHMGTTIALGATVVLGACNFAASIAGGFLSDRVGRKPVAIWPRVALILVVYPAYLAIVRFPSPLMLLGVTALLATINQMSSAVTVAVVSEIMPAPIRGLAGGGVYAVGVALFGGTTQFVIAALIGLTGDKLAPALYLAAAATIAVLANSFMPETAERFAPAQ